MRNKLKIAAVVVSVIVAMVFYKSHFDKKEAEKRASGKGNKDNDLN